MNSLRRKRFTASQAAAVDIDLDVTVNEILSVTFVTIRDMRMATGNTANLAPCMPRKTAA